jgi:glycosyltransferase involved in cell wall biosynthesis
MSDRLPYFSVIIPTYNRRGSLAGCLDALDRQTLPPEQFEVIVAVDGSTDGTLEMLAAAHHSYRLRHTVRENGGAGRARNSGAGLATGEYLAFTEDDVVPDSDWLAHAQVHLRDGNDDVLEGKTVYADSSASVRRFEPPGVPSFIPCNLIVRRTAFEECGGYDQEYFDRVRGLYFREDSDLGFRLLDRGCVVTIAPDVIVAHPRQFSTVSACIHHARRYVFDPLLYKRHKRRYREMIEVKDLGGMTIHRPQHYVALVHLAAVLLAVVGAYMGHTALCLSGLGASLVSAMVFRFKYQGRGALRPAAIHETAGFWIVPFVYLAALVRGCVRYRTFGVLL